MYLLLLHKNIARASCSCLTNIHYFLLPLQGTQLTEARLDSRSSSAPHVKIQEWFHCHFILCHCPSRRVSPFLAAFGFCFASYLVLVWRLCSSHIPCLWDIIWFLTQSLSLYFFFFLMRWYLNFWIAEFSKQKIYHCKIELRVLIRKGKYVTTNFTLISKLNC